MASDLNVVAIVGRLTRPAEIRYMPSGGTPLVRFSIAVNRARRSQDGVFTDEANYFDCVYFSRNAESLIQYLEKGRQVALQGELRQDRWEQEGQNRSKVEIHVNSLTLLSSSSSSTQRPQKTEEASGAAPSAVEAADQGPETFDDDDIPF